MRPDAGNCQLHNQKSSPKFCLEITASRQCRLLDPYLYGGGCAGCANRVTDSAACSQHNFERLSHPVLDGIIFFCSLFWCNTSVGSCFSRKYLATDLRDHQSYRRHTHQLPVPVDLDPSSPLCQPRDYNPRLPILGYGHVPQRGRWHPRLTVRHSISCPKS